MTVDDEILKELKEQTRFLKVNYGLLSEIKFELQNARKLSEATYKIKKPGAWVRFRYWLHGKLT
jgi:hypothetical protein